MNLVVALFENGYSWRSISLFLKKHPRKIVRVRRKLIITAIQKLYPGRLQTRLGFTHEGEFVPLVWPLVENPRTLFPEAKPEPEGEMHGWW